MGARVATVRRIAMIVVALGAGLGANAAAYTQTAAPVFINELHYDNAGTDAGEAVEIAGPSGTDLTGWSVVLYNGTGGGVYDTDALSGALADQAGGIGTSVLS